MNEEQVRVADALGSLSDSPGGVPQWVVLPNTSARHIIRGALFHMSEDDQQQFSEFLSPLSVPSPRSESESKADALRENSTTIIVELCELLKTYDFDEEQAVSKAQVDTQRKFVVKAAREFVLRRDADIEPTLRDDLNTIIGNVESRKPVLTAVSSGPGAASRGTYGTTLVGNSIFSNRQHSYDTASDSELDTASDSELGSAPDGRPTVRRPVVLDSSSDIEIDSDEEFEVTREVVGPSKSP